MWFQNFPGGPVVKTLCSQLKVNKMKSKLKYDFYHNILWLKYARFLPIHPLLTDVIF